MYHAGIGTFLQRDPLPQEGESWVGYSHEWVTRNLYQYVNSDPVNEIDPFGRVSIRISPSGAIGHPWRIARIQTRATTRILTDVIECKCVDCEDCPPNASLECRMELETIILIRTGTFAPAHPQFYGHEQRHVVNLQNEFIAIAWLLAQIEERMRCVDRAYCEAVVATEVAILRDRWKRFRADEAAHLHPPFDPTTAPGFGPDPIEGIFPPESP